MRTADIVDRLKSEVSALKAVDGAQAFTALKDGAVKRSPSAFVLPGNERAGKSKLSTGGIRQTVSVNFIVVIGFQNSGNSGERGVDAFEDVREACQNALLGWRSDGMAEAVTYGGTQVLGLDRKTGTAWFQLTFATSKIIQKLGGSS